MTGETFDIWMLLAGLGLFLFGIYLMEEADAACINGSSKAIRERMLKDMEATSLLMSNRLFTQSCRMYVFSIQNMLLDNEST